MSITKELVVNALVAALTLKSSPNEAASILSAEDYKILQSITKAKTVNGLKRAIKEYISKQKVCLQIFIK